MEKPADTRFEIHDLLAHRWSPRAFSERSVEAEKLRSLFEAARWAPSARNEQPWRFIIATQEDPDSYERLFGCLSDGNKRWAQRAPALVLTVAKMQFESNQRENRHAFHDVGLAVASLTLQATALGLHVHQMGGFDRNRARELFGIPDGFESVTVLALGYLARPEILPEDVGERERAPRTRKPFDAFVFAGGWGQTSALYTD